MFLPRLIPHAWSAASETARFLVLISPAGFERCFLEFSAPALSLTPPPSSAPPQAERMEALIAREKELGVVYA